MRLFIKLMVFACLLLTGCSTNYDPIIQHREELLQKTKNSSILIRNNFVIYEITDGDSSDQYFYRRDYSGIVFVNHLRNHKNITLEFDTAVLQKTVSDQLDYIEKFRINGYTQDFKEFGVSRKFYLDDYEQLLYIPYPDSLQGSYRNYVTKGKLLVAGWYLYKECINSSPKI